MTGPEAGAWVAAQIDGSYQPGSTAIGLWRASDAFDGLVAGVLYEQWNGVSIVAHIAISGRMTPAFLAAIFDYPFHVCGVRKVISPIASDNLRSIKLAINMGFEHEATLKDAAPTGDILLFTLTKTKCRFLEDRYGKKCPRAPAGP